MTEPTPEPVAEPREPTIDEVAAWCRQLGIPLTAELLARQSSKEADPVWDKARSGEEPTRLTKPPPCPVCGEIGVCALDKEGRALIHVLVVAAAVR